MDVSLLGPSLAGLVCAVAVALLTGPLRTWLVRWRVDDVPNARSSHDAVKPRGGGLAVFAVLLPAILAFGWIAGSLATMLPLVAIAAVLAVVSFADDMRGLPTGLRLLAQAGAVGLAILWIGPGPLLPGVVPYPVEFVLTILAWLWFINLYNFMDGIDGITAVETIAIGVGLGLVGLLAGGGSDNTAIGWLVAGALAGFLYWNWSPARVFLGDVGSVPLGFLLGWLLLDAAAAGHWAAALILPGYYLFDATVTLLRRAARFEKIWQAHREHAYQRAVQGGLGHAAVARQLAALNALLVACALTAEAGWPWLALAVAVCAVIAQWARLTSLKSARG